MKTKLILVEGIPGSGKTTTAQYIRDCVKSEGSTPLLYLENAHFHPVDIDNLSYLDENQYKKLLAQFSEYIPAINLMTEKGRHGYFIHYLKWFDLYTEKIPGDLLAYLMKYDAHDTLPPDKYHSLLSERWKAFPSSVRNGNSIVILECSLFQNPMTVFIGKHNYDISVVNAYIYELAKYVNDLNPILIYLRGDSVRQTLQRVIKTRPKEWIDLVISYITGQGYGKAHNLEGLHGVFSFYELLQEQMGIITANLDWNTLIINNTNWEWEQYHNKIANFIQRSI